MPWTTVEQAEFMRRVKIDNPSYEKVYSKIGIGKSDLHALVALLDGKANGTATPSVDQIKQQVAVLKKKKQTKYSRALAYLIRTYPDYDVQIEGNLRLKGFLDIADSEARKSRAVVSMDRLNELSTLCLNAVTQVVANTPHSPALGTLSGATGTKKLKATELFQKWFDQKRRPQYVDKVRGIFNRLAASVRNDQWEIVVYGTPEDPDPENLGGAIPKAFAFVVQAENTNRIYLAQYFFLEMNARIDIPTVTHAKSAPTTDEWQQQKKTKTAMDASIITMLHELTHISAIGNTTDEPPDPYGLETCKANAQNNAQLACNNAENYAQFASKLWMEKFFF